MKRAQKSAGDATTQRRLVEVAHLYYDENFSQQDIADRLGFSRSSIAHYLQHARETGIVRIEIVDPENACVELEAELRAEQILARLKAKTSCKAARK
jgi:deoxyribonucleoside regulator